jgi:hypothetical protein
MGVGRFEIGSSRNQTLIAALQYTLIDSRDRLVSMDDSRPNRQQSIVCMPLHPGVPGSAASG